MVVGCWSLVVVYCLFKACGLCSQTVTIKSKNIVCPCCFLGCCCSCVFWSWLWLLLLLLLLFGMITGTTAVLLCCQILGRVHSHELARTCAVSRSAAVSQVAYGHPRMIFNQGGSGVSFKRFCVDQFLETESPQNVLNQLVAAPGWYRRVLLAGWGSHDGN